MKLFFCQNVSKMGESFWQNYSYITHILFELWLIMTFSPIANFAQQSLYFLSVPLLSYFLRFYTSFNQFQKYCAVEIFQNYDAMVCMYFQLLMKLDEYIRFLCDKYPFLKVAKSRKLPFEI